MSAFCSIFLTYLTYWDHIHTFSSSSNVQQTNIQEQQGVYNCSKTTEKEHVQIFNYSQQGYHIK
jgi:hypothetical protein